MPEITQEQFTEYLKNPIMFPNAFKDWLSDYFATNIPKLHVSQIYGFKLQSVKEAQEITALNAITSTSYAAAGTDGPNMTGISNGFYIAMFGATFASTAGTPWYGFGDEIYMSPTIDGAAASDSNAAVLNAGSNGRAVLIDLTSGDHQHTIGFRYKAVGGTDNAVYNRWLYLIKVVTDA